MLPIRIKNQMWAGLIFGINFLSAFVMAPVWGSLADKKGKKNHGVALRIRHVRGDDLDRIGHIADAAHAFYACSTGPFRVCSVIHFPGGHQYSPGARRLRPGNAPVGRRRRVDHGPFIGGALAELIGFRMIFYLTGRCWASHPWWCCFSSRRRNCRRKKSASAGFFADGSFILHQRTLLILFSAEVFCLPVRHVGTATPDAPLDVERLGAPGDISPFSPDCA